MRPALGTFVAVAVEACSPEIAREGIARAFDAICEVQRLMHPHRAGSDVAALAACPQGATVRVHPWTWEVLELSRQLHVASGGLFDPCLSDAPGRFGDLEFPEPGCVRPGSRMRVDLGGIAKGYAVDRALEALRQGRCDGALVNAGGDLAVFGERAKRFLCRSSAETVLVELKEGALASSDTDADHRPPEHRGYYDGADRTRAIVGRVSVSAPCAALADALTKCALLCAGAQGDALLARFGAARVRTPNRDPDRRE